MRLVRVTHYYDAYLESYGKKFPDASLLPYEQQLAELLKDCFDWGYFWQQELPALGYEVDQLVVNHQNLQKTWARENGLEVDAGKWKECIVVEQLKRLEPDIVWLDDLHLFGSSFVRELRALFPRVKLWMAWSGSPLPEAVNLNSYDLILSNLPEQVGQFRSQGIAAEYLVHAFSRRVGELLGPDTPPKNPFTFVGSISAGPGMHNSRLHLLAYLAENTPLQIHSNLPRHLNKKPIKSWLYHELFRACSLILPEDRIPEKWRMRHAGFVLKNRIEKPVFGLEMFRKLQASQISLNQHIDVSRQTASNMRLFEATGVGSCLLTDWKSNLTDFFEPDREIVTYRSPQECREKYRWLSQHSSDREAIAQAGQRRTLKDHTFKNRAATMHEILKKYV